MNLVRRDRCFFSVMAAILMVNVIPAPVVAVEKRLEIPSSFNPVGSGARALGMGGAFIAVADDATAASWNPGGLTQLERPEISFVLEGVHRIEDIDFTRPSGGADSESISNSALNFMSAAYPFSLFGRNMTVSFNYQRLYDFTRQWTFDILDDENGFQRVDRSDYRQDGELSALGLAFAAEITPLFSVGVTVNRWDDDWTPNSWEQETAMQGAGFLANVPFTASSRTIEEWSFEGTNFNIGFLWRLTTDLTLGAVLKTPFDADIQYNIRSYGEVKLEGNQPSITDVADTTSENMEMPMSYGLGVAWQITREFRVALDVYRTEWDDFIRRTETGEELSPLTEEPAESSGIDPTHQVRFGVEYLYITDKLILPLTAGLFYDPAPATGSPDDIYGFSLGTGIGFGRFHMDVAYQYRFGNDLGNYILLERGFSESLSEHTAYVSMVVHFQ